MVLLIGPDGCGHEDHLVNQPSEIRSEGVGAPKWAVARGDDRIPIVLHRASICSAACQSSGETLGVGRRPASVGGHTMASCASRCSVRPGSWLPSAPAAPTERPLPPSLGGPKQRLVLAMLLAEPNRVVSVDRLVDALWGDYPPETARHTVQSYVSELRKALGSVITRRRLQDRGGRRHLRHLGLRKSDVSGSSAVSDRSRGCCGHDPRSARTVAGRTVRRRRWP